MKCLGGWLYTCKATKWDLGKWAQIQFCTIAFGPLYLYFVTEALGWLWLRFPLLPLYKNLSWLDTVDLLLLFCDNSIYIHRRITIHKYHAKLPPYILNVLLVQLCRTWHFVCPVGNLPTLIRSDWVGAVLFFWVLPT